MDSDIHIMVMPLLRTYKDPKMDTVGEAISFFLQAFEVTSFIILGLKLLLTGVMPRVCTSCTNST